jgi:hypothetical protein
VPQLPDWPKEEIQKRRQKVKVNVSNNFMSGFNSSVYFKYIDNSRYFKILLLTAWRYTYPVIQMMKCVTG